MGGKVYSEEYERYIICREFGWTYQEYSNTPPFFIREISIFLQQESLKTTDEMKKANAKI